MFKRTLILAILGFAIAAPCPAASLTVQLFPFSGEVRLRNTSAVSVPFVFYSIASPSGALNGSNLIWKSISDTYDVSGNGFIDPAFDWSELSATSTQLTESAFLGPGGSLAAFRSVSLGQIWSPALYPSHDLAITMQQADTSLIAITTQFAVAGDYDSNGTVNQSDYLTWRQNFGSTSNLNADGNLNGTVDAGDYTIWRNNLGLFLPGAGAQVSGGASLSLAGSIVPEPTTALLALSAVCAALIARGRARLAERFASHHSSAQR